jgi:hypothetical protein
MNQTVVAPTTDPAPVITIGANFAGSNIALSGFYPPDSDGAVGPGQFVELVNGVYRVYDKSGTVLQQLSLDQFWSSAGATPQGFAGDPRVLYDPESQRWFAAALDFNFGPPDNPSAYLLAVSNTSDPTQGWHAFDFGQTFDFTELGINKDGIYLSTTDGTAGNIDFVEIPKSDLLATTPTIANASFFKTFFGNTGPSPQPAIAPDLSGSEVILGVGPDALKISSIDSTATAPTLNTQDRTIIVPQGPQNTKGATQKGSTIAIHTGNLDFSSSVVMQGGKLFGVETIGLNPDQSHAALRWFEIGDPLTAPVVLDSGIISPPGLDVYYGSIAVNPLGQVVIGFSGSGADDYPSAYAVAGTLNGDVLQFGDPMLLKAGVAPETLPAFGNNTLARFGDYSTTTYDPIDPSHFWTIQEWTSASGWSTEISEIIFAPPAPTVQTWFGGTGNFSDPQNWSPAGSPVATDTLVIDAGRVRADNLAITNPNIRLGSPTTTPTLVLHDSTLAATSSVRVETTTFDPSQPDLEARIRVLGAVTQDGAIDVGTTGIDVNQLFPAHLTISMARGSSFTMDPGAIWFSSDGSTIDVNAPERSAQFVNNGEVEAFGGTVRMNVPVTGQGTFDVLFNNNNVRAGTLEFAEDVGTGETVKLDAGLLKLDEPLNFLGSIQDFNPDSTVELTHTKVTSADYSNGVLTLFDKHRVEARLDIVGDFTTEQFAIANHDGNAFVTLDPSASVSAAQSVNGGDGMNVDRQVAQLVSAMATHSAGNSGFDPMTTPTQTPNDSNLQSTLAPAWHS